MKKALLFTFLMVFVGLNVFAQSNQITVISGTQAKFKMILNDRIVNPQAHSSMTVKGIKTKNNHLTLLFKKRQYPNLDEVLDLPSKGKHYLFLLKEKQGKMKLVLMAEGKIGNFRTPNQGKTYDWYDEKEVENGGDFVTNNNSNVNNNNININVNVINENKQVDKKPKADHFVMEGYHGAIGCPWPMTEGKFRDIKRTIRSKTFESSKMTIAKQILEKNCLFSNQVLSLTKLFTYESTKLEFAKFAYDYTYDQDNYYKINNAFTYESSIDELNEYIKD
ncbi:MAG: DUF4476 domain-containing protein [Flavobacteriales bacterium]|jgi:hypothetical protein|nr:DUF4476 domain-containing protein [Flavobacteriales bacterium]